MRHFLIWLFGNRKAGAITVAQWPNVALWVVIVEGALRWIWRAAAWPSPVLTGVFNPWRRCLGAAVAAYEFSALPL
jgi:hypothetical protein